MKQISLDSQQPGIWTLSKLSSEETEYKNINAVVPSVVHLDLLRESKIDDPYKEYNEIKLRWIAKSDWEYSRKFEISQSDLKHERIVLVCEGLDTIATIFINDKQIGKSENMFVRYTFDIKDALVEGTNTIIIRFFSSINYANQQAKKSKYPIPCPSYVYGEENRNFIRKCGCDFGK